ncbi:MAG: SdpI family protein [Oscillospiraceae bacterium]
MGFVVFYVATMLVVPAVMLVCGWFMKNKPPKKINGWVGYRTPRSTKNMDTWLFAHKLCGVLFLRYGLWAAAGSLAAAVGSLCIFGENVQGVVLITVLLLQTVVLLVPVYDVEMKLKETFDENGNLITGETDDANRKP